MTVFDRLGAYGFIHHRALNGVASLNHARALVAAHPDRSHVFEGDVCWHVEDGREDIYFHHPDLLFRPLGAPAIDAAAAAGTLVRLDDLDALADEGVFVILELKAGVGDWRRALAKMVEFAQYRFRDRFWVDGFSLRLLRAVREIDPSVALSLHTECVYRGHALVAAPEWPPGGIRQLSGLDEVDAVAIRWHGSDTFMKRACADVLDAGKVLMLSRIHDLHQFRCSRAWRARAGYVHGDFDALVACDDEIRRKSGDRTSESPLAEQRA